MKSTENLIEQLESTSSEMLPMHELQGLDKQLRSIRGSLKVEVAKKLTYSNASSEKSISLRKSETIQNMMMASEKRHLEVNCQTK